METRVLKYFLAVAREENITKAAEQLHITQPTLSRQLAQLEEELGVHLFERGTRRTTLTSEGLLLRRRAEEIVELMDKTERELAEQEELVDGTVSIGWGELESVKFVASMLFVKATGTIAGVEYTITYWDVEGAPYMTVEDDNYTVAKLYLQEPVGPVLDIPAAFLGTWSTEDGVHTLVLSNDGTSTFDGEVITSFATGELSGEYVMEAAGVTYYLSATGTGEGAMIYLDLPDGYLLLYKA